MAARVKIEDLLPSPPQMARGTIKLPLDIWTELEEMSEASRDESGGKRHSRDDIIQALLRFAIANVSKEGK